MVKIHRGDTLQTIADRHNTDVRTLRALNNLRPHEQIRAGGTLKVPVQG
jgi:LysM repeat protein